MGFNSTVLVLNDAMEFIRRDPNFGEKVVQAILHLQIEPGPIDIESGHYINAATVIESHHAGSYQVMACGGNNIRLLGMCHSSDLTFMLKELADQMGFRLVRKPEKKRKEAS